MNEVLGPELIRKYFPVNSLAFFLEKNDSKQSDFRGWSLSLSEQIKQDPSKMSGDKRAGTSVAIRAPPPPGQPGQPPPQPPTAAVSSNIPPGVKVAAPAAATPQGA
jgi:hypothetical protein